MAYLVDGDDLLIGTSSAWGRNLRTGEPVRVRLRGKLREADVQVATTESDVVRAYDHMARVNPTFARFTSIRLDVDGESDPDDVRLAWRGGARAIRLVPR